MNHNIQNQNIQNNDLQNHNLQSPDLKFLDEFRDKELIMSLSSKLASIVKKDKQYQFMEFCGGHTHAIFQFGIQSLLPPNIRLVHGPGCPVCVLPRGRIDACVELLNERSDVILCTYGDLMRVPGSEGISFIKLKAQGKDIRMVYSPIDAVLLAEKLQNEKHKEKSIAKFIENSTENSDQNAAKKVVFLAIGFETTAPATALALQMAKQKKLTNFFVYCLHLLTPPAIGSVLEAPAVRELGTISLDGFIGPGHVSTVIGVRPYEYFAEEYKKPVVIAGFAPSDILYALIELVEMCNSQRAQVVNAYKRVVADEGNLKAQELMAEMFELRREFEWRGLGNVPYSALKLRQAYGAFDAELHLPLRELGSQDHKACLCGQIIRGAKKPTDCKLFGKACVPENPIGACMVSSEGTCAAYYTYGKAI